MAIDISPREASDNFDAELRQMASGGQPPPRRDALDAVHVLVASCLVGAGVIHLVMAPTHFGESFSDGIGFLVSGWAQLALAALVVLRPRRWVMWAVVASSVALIAGWIVSRTAGLPYGAHSGTAEDVGFVDGVCVALEAVALLGAILLIARGASRTRNGGLPRFGALGAIVIFAVGGLTTAALASPNARNHGAHSHGDTAAGAHDDGHVHDGGSMAAHSHGDASVLKGHDHSSLDGMENGQHRKIVQQKLSPLMQARVDTQLAASREVAALYPTVAHAEAAGYRRAGPFAAGLGAHYIRTSAAALNADGVVSGADLREPMSLIYHGTNGDAPIAGLMYYSIREAEPEGFIGPNDVWHYHKGACVAYEADGTINALVGDNQSPEKCAKNGGSILPITNWMVHVWTAPGYAVSKADGGVFAEVNPSITCGDGTYQMYGDDIIRPLNTCTSPTPPEQSSAVYKAAHGGSASAHSHGGTAGGAQTASAKGSDKGLGMLHNGHHAEMKLQKLSQADQAKLDGQIAATRRVAARLPTVADAMKAGYRRAGPFSPGLGVHYVNGNGDTINLDGVMDAKDLDNPMSIIYEGSEPTSKIAGYMYYSFKDGKPEGFIGNNDQWHYHTNVCTTRNADGTTDAPFGADRAVSKADCDRVGGLFMKEKAGWMVHVWSVPGYGLTDADGGMFGEVQPKLKCSDGTYFMMDMKDWPSHPLNVCRSAL